MKISVVSTFPPLKDNYKAPTALLYQLLLHRPLHFSVDLYYYDLVCTPEELIQADFPALNLSKIHKLSLTKLDEEKKTAPKAIDWFGKKNKRITPQIDTHPLPPQILLFQPEALIIEEINASNPDAVWLYPYWLVDWIEKIKCENVVISGMDSAYLHYERTIRYGVWSTPDEARELVDSLTNNYNLENKIARTRARVHMVGQADVEKFDAITNTQKAFFVPYPHHYYCSLKTEIDHCEGKINVVITGGNYVAYVGDHLKRIVAALVNAHDTDLKNTYHFHFIGKGYAEYEKILLDAGFLVSSQEWVVDFASELSMFQIQLFPIAVGTGTKGKVLSALASGLLGIGSMFAFENINIDPAKDSVVYGEPENIVRILQDISRNRPSYAEMAKRATQKIRESHSPSLTAGIFWQSVLV
jgi:hypothetical protein